MCVGVGVGDDGWVVVGDPEWKANDGTWLTPGRAATGGDEVAAAAVETSGRDRTREVRKGPTMEPTEPTEDGGSHVRCGGSGLLECVAWRLLAAQ